MTKLQLLHRALNERLMAAVEQVMEMVGGTVLEYEVEMVRARKENEELRRRLRWMEGENPTDWPDIEIDTSGSDQPVLVIDEPVQNCPSITIEPINVSDLQSLIPDAKLAAAVSIRSADLEIIRPKATEATISGISNNMGWVSSLSYMEPLDCDPTTKSGKGRSRSRRNMMSYACPDCGKVFGRKQNLNVHMRIHSADKPYAYRSRKACFYGDKKRKRKPHGLFKECPSREIVENKSDTAKSTGSATVCKPVATACNSLKAEPKKASKISEIRAIEHVGRRRTQAFTRENMHQCLECKKLFKKASKLAVHIKKTHRRVLASQKEQDDDVEINKMNEKSPEHSKLPQEEEKKSQDSNVRSDDSKTASELPEAKIAEANENNLESKPISRGNNKSKGRIPVESTEDTGPLERPLSCRECGKTYVNAGSLITHERSHIAKRLQKEMEKQPPIVLSRLREKKPKPQEQVAKPAKENNDGNGGLAETESHATVSQDHSSPSEPVESVEPSSAGGEVKFSLLPQQSSSASSNCVTTQAGTGLKLNSTLTRYFQLQPRIVLQPVNVKSKVCTLPEERDPGLVKTDPSAHVPMRSSHTESLPKQRISDIEPVCVDFSDADGSDDNDWSDVLHHLDEDLAQQQTAPEKLADVETVDISHLESPQKDIDASSDVEFIPERTEKHSARGDLSNSDDVVATSVQVTGKHGGSTGTICGLKFASKPSLSRHMRIHNSPGHTRRSVNFEATCNIVDNSETKVEEQVGGEQTPEAQKEDSTSNLSEIIEEMDSEMCSFPSLSQSPTHDPDIDTSTISTGGSETKAKSRKPKKKSMEKKVLYCRFCDKACRKIDLHLKFDHPREPEGSYRRNQFWKHALVCKPKKAEEESTVSEAADSVCIIEPSPENKSSKAEKSPEKVMKDTTSSSASEELANAPVHEDHPSTVRTTADRHTGNLSLDASSADVQRTVPTTANPCISVSGGSDNLVPNLKSGCSPVQDGVSSETGQPSDPEAGHVKEEMDKNGEDTGNTCSDLGLPLDFRLHHSIKRKLDSQDSEITEAKTKKKMQSDSLQPADEEAEAAAQSKNCPHCSATSCSPHQCTSSD
uniref:C2H2-type domain-containing protein n=1 Tax=Astyanax mexicanus TaxID=7994 RepID=W5K7F9_ASTMX